LIVDVYEDYSCFGEVSFFAVSQVSKWNRAAIKFCVKLKETAKETFEMLKSTYVEEWLSRTSVIEWHKMFKEAQKQNAKIAGEINVDCIF
jgi:hypothetical protein